MEIHKRDKRSLELIISNEIESKIIAIIQWPRGHLAICLTDDKDFNDIARQLIKDNKFLKTISGGHTLADIKWILE